MIKADLHNHLGKKGTNPGFDKTLDLVYKRLGPNSIFGIANFDDFRYEEFIDQKGGKYERVPVSDKRAIYVPEKNMLVVKCQEMLTKEGDVLAIAMPYRKNIKTKNTKDAIIAANDLEAILDAVHPFYLDGVGNFMKKNFELFSFFSTFEVYNGSLIFVPGVTPMYANKKALDFYISHDLEKQFGIGMSSSTDGHSVKSIGKCFTLLDDFSLTSKNLPLEIRNALKNVKSLYRLHMEPNYFDAFKHAVHIGFNCFLSLMKK